MCCSFHYVLCDLRNRSFPLTPEAEVPRRMWLQATPWSWRPLILQINHMLSHRLQRLGDSAWKSPPHHLRLFRPCCLILKGDLSWSSTRGADSLGVSVPTPGSRHSTKLRRVLWCRS